MNGKTIRIYLADGVPNGILKDTGQISLAAAGDLAGKVLLDRTNPLTTDVAVPVVGTTDSAGEQVANTNTNRADSMADPDYGGAGVAPPSTARSATPTPTRSLLTSRNCAAGSNPEAVSVPTVPHAGRSGQSPFGRRLTRQVGNVPYFLGGSACLTSSQTNSVTPPTRGSAVKVSVAWPPAQTACGRLQGAPVTTADDCTA
jgi:hypothetical protein